MCIFVYFNKSMHAYVNAVMHINYWIFPINYYRDIILYRKNANSGFKTLIYLILLINFDF